MFFLQADIKYLEVLIMPSKSKTSKLRRAEIKRAAEEVSDIRISLEHVYKQFDQTTDPELMDSYIYEINSLRARYDYALKRAKNRLS